MTGSAVPVPPVEDGPGAALVRGDALALPLGDNTVDLIVTSPPYFALRSYSDGGEHYDGQIGSEATPTAFLEALWAVTAECWRVLKPTGSLFVNLGDKYAGSGGHNNAGIAKPHTGTITFAAQAKNAASRPKRREAPDRYNQASDGIRAKSLMGLPWRYAIGCIDGRADPDGVGWVLRQDVIWSKPNGLPESVKDRARRSHEYWFHLTKQGTYWSDMDAVKVPAATADPSNPSYRACKSGERRKDIGSPPGKPRSLAGVDRASRAADVLPPSVWTISTVPLIVPDWLDVDHFAAFPTEWPRRLILGWCPPEVCRGCGCPVVESTDGTSTTAMQAVRQPDHGRAHQTEGGSGAGAGDQPVLLEDLFGWLDGGAQGVDQGVRDDHEGIPGASPAGSPDGGPDRLCAGTPTADGRAPGSDADGERGRSSPEWGLAGQPAGEPGADAEATPRQEVGVDQAAPDRVPVLRSRGARNAGCPQCGETETTPGVVLDVFGGTGTTAMVARALGRYGVSMDLSADYLRLARWRIWQSGGAAKVAARTDRDRQGDLFAPPHDLLPST